MDLRAKLRLHQQKKDEIPGVEIPNQTLPASPDLIYEPINEDFSLTRLLPCKAINSDCGEYLLAEYHYPLNHFHGANHLGAITQENLSALCGVVKDQSFSCPLTVKNLLFLDTETTGLAGGAGTYAFLIGIGFFAGDEFVVQQYMMDDYHQELAMLDAVYQKLQDHSHLVTFNGRTFDWPLLEGRFIYHRMRSKLRPIHVDLLHPARRYYKQRLESCRLSHLEAEVLGFHRVGDISGAEVPTLFFNYLQERDGRLLAPVFQHNHWDILSLVTLLTHLVRAYLLPEEVLAKPEDLFSAGKIHEDLAQFEQAITCYRQSLSLAQKTASPLCQEILARLSFLYKRLNRMQEACDIWEEFINSRTNLRLFPYLELAKYFEHQCKDYTRALEITHAASELLTSQRRLYTTAKFKEVAEELAHREERLLKKLGKSDQQSALLGLD